MTNIQFRPADRRTKWATALALVISASMPIGIHFWHAYEGLFAGILIGAGVMYVTFVASERRF